jgi:polar amino acid transport system substrate-binding protein
MKRFLVFVLTGLLIASTLVAGCSGSGGKVRVATDATWAPFEFVDDQNKIVGFDIDLMNAIADKAGLDIEYVNVGFDALLAGMAAGTYDAAISSITIKPERAENMLFTDPYYVAGQMIVVRSNNTSITGQSSLSGKKLGAQLATTGESLAKENTSEANVKSYNSIGLAVQDLLNDQIDAVICDTPVAESYVKENSGSLKTVGGALTTEDYGIAVAKGKEDLLKKINDALRTVKSEGLIDQLVKEWLA